MLSLDIATKCGYCYDKISTLVVGTIEGTPSFQLERIKSINVDFICIEDLVAFNSPNPSTLVTLAKRFGYLLYSLQEIYAVQLIHPGTWRKYLGLSQKKIAKKQLQDEVMKFTNIQFSLDETDAIGLWLTGSNKTYSDLSNYEIVKVKKQSNAISTRNTKRSNSAKT